MNWDEQFVPLAVKGVLLDGRSHPYYCSAEMSLRLVDGILQT